MVVASAQLAAEMESQERREHACISSSWKLSAHIGFPEIVDKVDLDFILACLRNQAHIVRHIASKVGIFSDLIHFLECDLPDLLHQGTFRWTR